MESRFINNFQDFLAKRVPLAKILREHKPELKFQWFWLADRSKREENINITACRNPFSRSGDFLRQEQGFELLADALSNYAARDWEFKPKIESKDGRKITHESAVFAVFIKDNMGIDRIYTKIAIQENANMINLRTNQSFRGDRIKLWSFKNPRF